MVGYMTDAFAAQKRQDAGWKVGVRTTVTTPVDVAWKFLLGEGLPLWLGRTTLKHDKGAKYQTDDDIRGETVSFAEGFRVRVTWQPGEWDHDSTLQLTVKAAAATSGADGTLVEFEHTRLTGREERKIMLGHWKDVLGDIEAALNK
jgi:uncharacterized protein YndB with AHSA1/START domain